ncbi:MAG: hypothetical protein AAF985_06385 [Bacteroidota bacterium]
MTFKFKPQFALFALIGLMVLSSCTKEVLMDHPIDSKLDQNVQQEQLNLGGINNPVEVKPEFKMIIDGKEMTSDVVAAYCQNGDKEFLIVANKAANLNFPLETQNFEEGDFTYITSSSAEGSWGMGGQALGEDITGFAGLLITFSESTITIEDNDGTFVTGSAEGTLYFFDDITNPTSLTELPYSMDFVAEIVQESDFCD